jgi:hypothetical protein
VRFCRKALRLHLKRPDVAQGFSSHDRRCFAYPPKELMEIIGGAEALKG